MYINATCSDVTDQHRNQKSMNKSHTRTDPVLGESIISACVCNINQ